MARKHKQHHGMPGWFPFALAASAVTILFAGARSGWKLAGDKPAPRPTPQIPPVQSGVVQEWSAYRFS